MPAYSIPVTEPVTIKRTVTTEETDTVSALAVDSLHVRPNDAPPWIAVKTTDNRETRFSGADYSAIIGLITPEEAGQTLGAVLAARISPLLSAARKPAPVAPEPDPVPSPDPAPEPVPQPE